VDERDWDRLVEQLLNGDCTPFLGAGACGGTLPTGSQLSQRWADHLGYPFDDSSNLPSVMQYATIIKRDAVTVKQTVAREISELGRPDFTNQAEPHSLLAQLPIPVYLTTNYDDFMAAALEHAGKHPKAAVCPWYRDGHGSRDAPFPRDYQPCIKEPVVYHLHGRSNDPASLVLNEQDYVEFLIKLALERGMNNRKIIPLQILPALTKQPLLFIGYSLRDWSFRVLFSGLVRAVADVHQRRHVSVQLPPLKDNDDGAARKRAEEYLATYFEHLNISVYWGTAHDFCGELSVRLGSV
jgi:hypothetical protein